MIYFNLFFIGLLLSHKNISVLCWYSVLQASIFLSFIWMKIISRKKNKVIKLNGVYDPGHEYGGLI
jgi:hypothetical protein